MTQQQFPCQVLVLYLRNRVSQSTRGAVSAFNTFHVAWEVDLTLRYRLCRPPVPTFTLISVTKISN